MKEIPDVITASEARLLRKELTRQSKPAKGRKKIEKSEKEKAYAKADKWFSLYFRGMEADENGRVVCAGCSKSMNWKESDRSCQTGHYESRGFNNTRFNPKNVAIECRQCNYFLEGNKEKLKEYMVNRYSEEEIAEISILSRIPKKFTVFDLGVIAQYYKNKFEAIVKTKGLIL